MRVGIASVGSRGDVQPFLALAVALQRAGHAVRLATCEPFRALVTGHGVEFAAIGGDIKAMVGHRGRAALVAAGTSPLRNLRALREHVGPLVRDGLDRLPDALDGCDVILGQILAPGAAHYAERHGLPYFDAAYVPVFPTRAFAHPGAPTSTPPGIAAWLSHLGAEQVFWQAFRPDVDAFRRRLGLGRARWLGPSVPVARRPPALLGYTRAIVPRPDDWPEHVTVTGAWLLDPPADWRPPDDLLAFLAAGPPPVYVGFGSMTVEEPEALTAAVVAALRRAGLRGVLSTGWGALAPADGDDVWNVGDVPHAWLFPQMAAIVHHGGASTTADALRAGVPQLVAPFLSDQPFWGARVAASGVGPTPIPVGRVTADGLHDALIAMASPAMRERAAAIGAVVRAERGGDDAVAAIERRAR
jgi:sterol 3beta-glucosyltransferase